MKKGKEFALTITRLQAVMILVCYRLTRPRHWYSNGNEGPRGLTLNDRRAYQGLRKKGIFELCGADPSGATFIDLSPAGEYLAECISELIEEEIIKPPALADSLRIAKAFQAATGQKILSPLERALAEVSREDMTGEERASAELGAELGAELVDEISSEISEEIAAELPEVRNE